MTHSDTPSPALLAMTRTLVPRLFRFEEVSMKLRSEAIRLTQAENQRLVCDGKDSFTPVKFVSDSFDEWVCSKLPRGIKEGLLQL